MYITPLPHSDKSLGNNNCHLNTSIIIPTYRRPAHLINLVKSLMAYGYTTRPDIEIIIVFNDSSNGSEIINWKETTNIICLSQPCPGRSAALNLGSMSAKGKYIVCLDDDTIILDPNWLDTLIDPFERDPSLGYVGGKVVAWHPSTPAQVMWESKGGLSKGNQSRTVGKEWFLRKRLVGVPVRSVAVGANCAIPLATLLEIGGFDERFGPGSIIPHGESLDICYRLLRAGYALHYEPKAIVAHFHPEKLADLRRKMLIYGIGDTAIHSKFLVEYGDIAGLYEILWGRSGLLFYRMLLRLFGRYPLSLDMLFWGFIGALIGPLLYWWAISPRYRFSKKVPANTV